MDLQEPGTVFRISSHPDDALMSTLAGNASYFSDKNKNKKGADCSHKYRAL